jgi:hypothetical protein
VNKKNTNNTKNMENTIMNGFQSMKSNRQSFLDSLSTELEKTQTNNSNSYEDERIWKCERDKSGNGYAVIRFLPPSTDESTPWVRIFSHGFQGQGGWYIENSLTTFNDKDPVSEFNTSLWNNGTESGKEQARKQKRRLNYFSNIYVVEDPANPQNNGQVRLFKYGKKIFDKINDLMNPEFKDETPVNPFDLWGGANFKIKIRMVDGFVNYDKSEFDSITPLSDDEEEMEKIWTSQYSLQELLERDNFKTYDELKIKLDRILGLDDDPSKINSSDFATREAPAPVTAETFITDSSGEPVDDDDKNLSYFANLANNQ